MCEITGKEEVLKEYTGYKAVLKIKGQYYSPSTGYRYRLGGLPNLNKTLKNVHKHWTSPFKDKKFFNKQMQGKTGVFVLLSDMVKAIGVTDNGVYTVLKMTITGDMHTARLNHGFLITEYADIIVGSEITKMEETDINLFKEFKNL